MENDIITKKINDTERAMGFISIKRRNCKLFPNSKTKIILNDQLSKQKFLCTYDPKYSRIYGLRKLFSNNTNRIYFTIISFNGSTYNIVFK